MVEAMISRRILLAKRGVNMVKKLQAIFTLAARHTRNGCRLVRKFPHFITPISNVPGLPG